MLIYKDIISGDEVLSDTFKIVEDFDGAILKVDAKFVAVKSENDFNIGGNPSADNQEEGDGLDTNVRQVIDIVDNSRLVEVSFDKKTYMGSIKEYMKQITNNLTEKNPGRVDGFKKAAQEFVKQVIGSFDDYVFYTGEAQNLEGMIILAKYDDTGVKPTFYFWKDGLKEEKV